jgi:hypothetical protein
MSRSKRVLRSALTVMGLIVPVSALAGCGAASRPAADHAVRAATICRPGQGGLVVARPLRGDQLAAGPVLVDHQAVWAESLHRIRIRSVDLRGCTKTLFTSAVKSRSWDQVESFAGGDGRVAMVETMTPCSAARPNPLTCNATGDGPSPLRVVLLSGPPGHIRPIETRQHLDNRRCVWVPEAVAIVNAGLVVQEVNAGACQPFTTRLVLRNTAGRLVRVLARGATIIHEVAAGRWVMYTTYTNEDSADQTLHAVNVKTGQSVLRLHPDKTHAIAAYAIDARGRFAFITGAPESKICGRHEDPAPLREGQIGHAGLRLIDNCALSFLPDISIAISGDRIAYGRRIPGCRDQQQLVVKGSASTASVVDDLSYSKAAPLRFDGRVIATARGHAPGNGPGTAILLQSVRSALSTSISTLTGGSCVSAGLHATDPANPWLTPADPAKDRAASR